MADTGPQSSSMPPGKSQRGSLFVTFIGGALLGASALWTVTGLQAPPQHEMPMPSKAGGTHEMQASNMVDVGAWQAAPTLDAAIYRDPGSGWNLNVITTNFTFDAAAAGRENIEGHGHAHVYVNGMKLGRVYGAWHHIGKLPLGRNEVTVSLYANDHSALALGGTKITASVEVIVE